MQCIQSCRYTRHGVHIQHQNGEKSEGTLGRVSLNMDSRTLEKGQMMFFFYNCAPV